MESIKINNDAFTRESTGIKNQLNVFEKYADCFTEYASLIECQTFEIGFKLAVKLLKE